MVEKLITFLVYTFLIVSGFLILTGCKSLLFEAGRIDAGPIHGQDIRIKAEKKESPAPPAREPEKKP